MAKKDIHPEYHPNAKVTCSCGNSFEIGSTMKAIDTEICSACHSFYTGKEKILDSMGQIQKFRQRLEKKQTLKKK